MLSTLATPTKIQPVNISLISKVEPYFENFGIVGNETSEEIATLNEMKDAALQWCCDIALGNNPYWLSLLGHSGTGKTLLSKCCMTFLFDHGERLYHKHYRHRADPESKDYLTLYSYAQEGTIFVKWSALLDKARSGDYSVLDRATADWVKIVDDIGAESVGKDGLPTPFAISTLSKLCDFRVGKWTIFTSNFSRSQLAERFDTRIASRMMRDGNVIVESQIRDFNLRKEVKLGSETLI